MSTLIETKHLKKYFKTGRGTLHAVDDVSLKIEEGTTLGCVGESGCGKSTFGRTLIHLHESTEGQILFEGKDITTVNKKELKELRHKMQIIFQDPYSSINPRMTVEDLIREPLLLAGKRERSQLNIETKKLMDMVGIDRRMMHAYPHELDGGRRQRVGIARALALNPKFVVCDEPVSALDVSVQAQVLNLLLDLQKEHHLTYMFVTHDMSVVKYISDEICVMYLGQVVEKCPSKELFAVPMHPYTKALLSAIPRIDLDSPHKRIKMNGELTSPIDPQPGCRFAARCMYATDKCKEPQELKETTAGHFVSCCRVNEIH